MTGRREEHQNRFSAGTVCDAGLEAVKGLPKLKTLRLSDEQVTDGALRFLNRIGSLHGIEMAISGENLGPPPRSQAEVTFLDLRQSKVTDAGLQELAPLKNLQSLHLQYRNVTDLGLRELTSFTKLTNLNVGNTKISDAGLKHIATLANLKVLNLGGTSVSDSGLKELAGLKNLTVLALEGA